MSEDGAMDTLGCTMFEEVTIIQWPKREAMTSSHCNANGTAAKVQAEGIG